MGGGIQGEGKGGVPAWPSRFDSIGFTISGPFGTGSRRREEAEARGRRHEAADAVVVGGVAGGTTESHKIGLNIHTVAAAVAGLDAARQGARLVRTAGRPLLTSLTMTMLLLQHQRTPVETAATCLGYAVA